MTPRHMRVHRRTAIARWAYRAQRSTPGGGLCRGRPPAIGYGRGRSREQLAGQPAATPMTRSSCAWPPPVPPSTATASRISRRANARTRRTGPRRRPSVPAAKGSAHRPTGERRPRPCRDFSKNGGQVGPPAAMPKRCSGRGSLPRGGLIATGARPTRPITADGKALSAPRPSRSAGQPTGAPPVRHSRSLMADGPTIGPGSRESDDARWARFNAAHGGLHARRTHHLAARDRERRENLWQGGALQHEGSLDRRDR